MTLRRAFFALLLVASPQAAFAAGNAHDADALFEEGKRLVDKGNYAAACGRFEASLAEQPGLGTRLWLADCYEVVGRTASAYRQFRIAVNEARVANDKRGQVAEKRVAALEPRLTQIVLDITTPVPDERIEVDGVVATAGSPVPVDPGRHLVSASAAGHARWQTTFDALATDHALSVVVPALLASGDEVPAAPVPRSDKAVVPPPLPRESPKADSTYTTVGLAVGGAGALTMIGSGVLLGLALSDKADSKNGCALTCTPEAHATGERAVNRADAATAVFVIGAALVAGGAALYLFAPKTTDRVARKRPTVDLTPLGLQGAF